MLTQKMIVLLALYFTVQSQTLSQIVLQGTVTDNGAEYLGGGAEAVVNALVTVTDQADTSRSFSSYTNEQGHYSIQITPTGVDAEASAGPADFRLLQNYPNPFHPATVIGYELAQPSHVTIQVYSVLGRKVKTLVNGFQNNSGQVVWDGTDMEGRGVPAGVYLYSLEANGCRIVRKMTLIDHNSHWSKNSAAVALSKTIGQSRMNKHADLYFMRITDEEIETYEQRDISITGNLVLDVSVHRTVTDIDGNVYRTVKIGDQWWMAENLKVTRYRNGDLILNVIDTSQWANLTTGAWCAYDNNAANADTYGLLYNWDAVNDSRNIAPAGWHVPTDAEWDILVDYLGGDSVGGGKMKETGTAHWRSPNAGATNESGFSGLPGGIRFFTGYFHNMGSNADFWSSTEDSSYSVWIRQLIYEYPVVYRYYHNKLLGFSVRCVRGDLPTNTPPAASFTVSPSNGTISTDFQFDASGCSDSQDAASVLQVRWDWENDGAWDTNFSTTKTAVHAYTTAGTKTVKLEVRDSGGLTNSIKQQLAVSDDSGGKTGTVSDIDGNVYKTIKIGDQWWMAENLKVTTYRDGESIPNVTDNNEWVNLTTGAWCAYKNDLVNVDTYGLLYNWYAVNDSRSIAPAGWHVPTDAEWKILVDYLGGDSVAGGKMKEAGTAHWQSPNDGATNESGFSGLPGGYRDSYGNFDCIGRYAWFWSSTEYNSFDAWSRSLDWFLAGVSHNYVYEVFGISVRCLRD